MLTYLQLLFFGFRQQIFDSLVVYFQHADLDLKGPRAVLIAMNFIEDFITDDRDDTFIGTVADHGVALS